ncbi:MAG: E3 ubiquitin-protein ligase BRE1B [Marteilia pararefringens]
MIKEQAETTTSSAAAAGGVATTTPNSTNAAAVVTNSNLLHNHNHHHKQQHSDDVVVDDDDCGMSKLAEIGATQPLGKISKRDSDISGIDHIDSRSSSSSSSPPPPPQINHNMKLEESAAIMSFNALPITSSGNDSVPQQPAFTQIRAKAPPLAKNSRSIRSGGKSATGLKISASSIPEIDNKMLKFQNQKLGEAIRHYKILHDRLASQKDSLVQENDRLSMQIIELQRSMENNFKEVELFSKYVEFSSEKFSFHLDDILSHFEEEDELKKKLQQENDINKIDLKMPQADEGDSGLLSGHKEFSNFINKLRTDIFNNISHQCQFLTFIRLHSASMADQDQIAANDLKLAEICSALQNLQQDLKNFIQFSINVNDSKSLLSTKSLTADSIYESFANDKIDELKKIINQLETDISFKEQHIIKYENLLKDAEYTIDNLQYDLNNATRETLPIHTASKNPNINKAPDSADLDSSVSTNSTELMAMIKSKDGVIDKLHADIEQFETNNASLSKKILQMDQFAQLTTLADLTANSSVYNKVKEYLDLVISEKRCMEQFFTSKLYNSENIINSELRSFSENIKSQLETMNSLVLNEKTFPNEGKIQELTKDNMLLTNELKVTKIILERRNVEIDNLKTFLTQLQSFRKQTQIENTDLSNLVLKLRPNDENSSCIENIQKNSSLTNINDSTILNYLKWITENKLHNYERLAARDTSGNKNALFNLVSLFRQSVEKIRLYIKLQKTQQSNETRERLKEIGLSDAVRSLKKKEEILMKELDITGNAFEQLQDQNSSLLEQLKQRDENLIKLNNDYTQLESIIKLRSDQLKEFQKYNESLKTEMKLQQEVLMKMESHNDNVNKAVSQIDIANKKLIADKLIIDHALKQREAEMSELKGEIERYKVSGDLLQSSVTELEATIITERSVKRKLLAQIKSLQSQVNVLRAGKSESELLATDLEANYTLEDIPLLMEEIKEYKMKLTCPCCNFRPKNAILLRCYHVFCMECLISRYETRQRKCPKCNAYFGQNDYKKIYLE